MDGFDVTSVHTAPQGTSQALAGKYDLVVLDVMLPGGDGRLVLRKIRATSDVPIVMLTARGDEGDRIAGLEAGADDYLPKPFNARELVARMRGRPQAASSEKPLCSTVSNWRSRISARWEAGVARWSAGFFYWSRIRRPAAVGKVCRECRISRRDC